MTGHKNKLNVYLGQDIIANLSWYNEQLSFEYTAEWKETGYAISPHLPLVGEISAINIQKYLRNLFPEGESLEMLAHFFHLSKQNTFGIVHALGADTSGALLFLPEEKSLSVSSAFREITPAEIEERLAQRDFYHLIVWDGKPRLSVAGVQDKINVILNKDGQIGFGEGRLCSTHLLKFEKQALSHLVINEYMTMQLAKQCGLEVANIKLLRFKKYPALLVERFDRKLTNANEVFRRHMIDGCQALNLAPEYKYERNFGSGRDVAHIREGASLVKLFDFANQCTNPAETKNKLLDWVLFNLLINNYDAHGKNISFFVRKNGISLTPFYDLVNIKMYPKFENQLAMAIGDDFDGDTVGAYQLAGFAENCQLPPLYIEKQLIKIISALSNELSNNIFLSIAQNEDEKKYIRKYQKIIQERCDYLLMQAKQISDVKL